ncbi:hypothetical protein [Paludisphaera rhizosphaerae]|uniref:hypothetical protein n=1 Tax=Paludisphaera rhizosphaerae TaxID=2711216 RepID=UPI0013EBEAD6|nr:hypothetical protein [Paludisphaera rhizosphaerae]
MTLRFRMGLAALILAVSPLPWLLILQSIEDEPFNVFRIKDAVLYLGFSSALIVVLAEIALVVLFGVLTRRLSGWWLVPLLWLAVLGFMSFAAASDWVGDVARSPVWQSQGASGRDGAIP